MYSRQALLTTSENLTVLKVVSNPISSSKMHFLGFGNVGISKTKVVRTCMFSTGLLYISLLYVLEFGIVSIPRTLMV